MRHFDNRLAAATVPVQSFAQYWYGSSDAGSERDDEEDGEDEENNKGSGTNTAPKDMDVDMDEINYITSISTQQNSSALRINKCENSGLDPDIHNPSGHDRLKQI
ncbi:hypothetical protein F5876DRAFT_80017 [Lentinula aff. lateritia]|uniref:Uncharacterized protein n=1 Tax=Lentinula aff. lateritia TaxID=2804960 RepID=A0ACC1TR57_9AGAR|nr:hypothetical protein F5876DRAFT_80017 [Lentinula aff. lateritia]